GAPASRAGVDRPQPAPGAPPRACRPGTGRDRRRAPRPGRGRLARVTADRRPRSGLRGVLLALLGVALMRSAAVAATPPTEYEVKAAFLYNFARFVEWPADQLGDAEAP